MPKHQPYMEFTAQSRNISALNSMYAQLDHTGHRRMELTPIIVFMAFSIESYLNSLGARHLAIWDEVERLPWRDKVTILHKTAGRQVDWGKDPLQFAAEIFKLRDKLAHGKPERVLGPEFDNGVDAELYIQHNTLQPEWYKRITEEWIKDARRRFRNLMIYLGDLFGLPGSDHLHTSTGGTLRYTEDDA